LRRAQDDPAAFAPIYERYVDRIYGYCRSRTSDEHEAEDLCSQVFAKALTSLHTYNGGMVAAWLFRIAHNLVIDHYRRRKPIVSIEHVTVADDDPFDWLEEAEAGDLLNALIRELPDDKRNLLALSLDRDLTSQDVGEIVGKSAGAVRIEFHRIVKQLRTRYMQLTGETIS